MAGLLQRAGHEAIAVDLPADDPERGLSAYADLAVAAVQGRTDVVLVAQSMGGFTAPLVAARLPLRALVLVNAMIPLPGESANAWGEAVGSEPARRAAAEAGGYSAEFDLVETFLHDVPTEVLDPAERRTAGTRPRSPSPSPVHFERWPDIATKVLVGRDDRLFPADLQVRVARERLGVAADVRPGGHLIALANPRGWPTTCSLSPPDDRDPGDFPGHAAVVERRDRLARRPPRASRRAVRPLAADARGDVRHGSNALVVRVRRGDERLALRLSPPGDDVTT